jgi:2-polyprenyl-6-methoxyphenol hydroxylase-like FAD-dependent oxidoreductase
MAPLNILICGGGIAGPALAYWLSRIGHRVVVVEKHPVLRATGAQIDLRGQAIEVVKRMGLHDAIRSKLVDEAGMAMVDSEGNVKATVLANKSGKGAQSLTSEYEIMRGDLVRIFHEATKDKVEYIFGKTVDRFTRDEKEVIAYFSDGSSDTFDILVGADGQGSRIRKGILPANTDPYRHLGVHMAYWFIPRDGEMDSNMGKLYTSPGGRMIMTRSHNASETQVYFFLRSDSDELRSISRVSVEQQKAFWAQRFHDAGWDAKRFIDGMEATDNWFCHEAVQVQLESLYSGRVVLLGDAAHCPSPLTGLGTTSSLFGAYDLAGEIARNEVLTQAFQNYHDKMQPYIKKTQEFSPSILKLALPDSQWGIAILHLIVGLICFLRIPQLVTRFSTERDGASELPHYPELEVDGT